MSFKSSPGIYGYENDYNRSNLIMFLLTETFEASKFYELGFLASKRF
jgi:hypothetical protein